MEFRGAPDAAGDGSAAEMCVLCELAGVDLHKSFNDGAGTGLTVAGAPPVFTDAQIVQQLRTQWGGIEGATVSWAAGSAPISYYMGGNPYPSGSSEIPYTTAMTALMQSRAALAFELWDDLIARDLTQTTTAASGQIQAEYATQTDGGGTYAGLWGFGSGTGPYGTPNYTITRSEIWFNSNWTSHDQDADMYFGGYGFQTYIHEIGHTLGLSHPGSYNAGNGIITYGNSAEFAQDNRRYTVMSYFGGYQLGSGWQQDGTYANWYYSSTPMLYDVAAIQAIYGADTTTRTTDTVYGFNCNLAADDPRKAIFDFSQNAFPIYTIWDAGGIDALDGSGYGGGQTIDLRAGTYSSLDGMTNNIAIAFGCTVENAVGGSGADVITGNSADNVLTGRAGNDLIDGGGGIDTAVFAGLRAAYTINALDATTLRVVGADGTDTLTNIELLRFDDQLVAVGPEVAVSGNGIDIADGDTTPNASDGTDFGTVQEGATVDRVFTVSNTGTATLATAGLTLPSGFILIEGLSGSIEPGGLDTFTVRIDTSTPGTKGGQITFTDNDGNESPFNFSIAGTVTPAAAPEIAVSGGGIGILDGDLTPGSTDGTDFGFAMQGATVDRLFTVRNTGNATLTISAFTLPSGFLLVESLSGSIAPGASDTFTVRLDTTGDTGTRSGQITFATNDGDEDPFNFTVTGTVTPGNRVVSAGVVSAGLPVSAGGTLHILAGGTASGTMVGSGGTEIVSAGGVASATTVSSGGLQLDFGTAIATTVRQGGELIVRSGGIASGATTSAGAWLTVVAGGTVRGAILSGGLLDIASGGATSGVGILSGGRQNVSGATTGTVVGSGGNDVVYSGGIASGTVVSNGGIQSLYAGAIASGTVILSGGVVLDHGTMVDAVVHAGGELNVRLGGVASATSVSGGVVLVSAGAAVRGATLSGGLLQAYSGGATSTVTLLSGGRQNVYGTTTETVVSSGGTNVVWAGATASGSVISGGGVEIDLGTTIATTVRQGGELIVRSGGIASGATTSAGAWLTVVAGGSVRGAILSGGLLDIASGGTTSGVVILSGGRQNVSGTTTGTVVGSGGNDVVYSGGVASGTTVSNGGMQSLYAGAIANGTVILSGGVVLDHGTMVDAVVRAGGELNVRLGGVASGTTVSGGVVLVSAGGAVRGAILSGGLLQAYSGGATSTVTLLSGGRQNVYGTTTETVVSSGGTNVVWAGATASGSVISSGGVEFALGTTIDATVRQGGELIVRSGGIASGATTVTGAWLTVVAGGIVRGATLNGGLLDLASGGTTSSVVLLGGARQNVSGTAFGTLVGSGGLDVVYGGGYATGTVVATGGRQALYAGAVASGTLILSGGVHSINGTVIGETVHAGGIAYVMSGAVISGGTLNGGTLEIRNGGTAGTSTITFASGGGLLRLGNAQDFDGLIAGFDGPDRIDLADIAFGAGTTLAFAQAPDNTSGTLTVSDGVRSASLLLLGQYSAASFALTGNGAGGTMIVDPLQAGIGGLPPLGVPLV
jgi:autotransporter passenger strand-loop-strand repeat protein